MLTRIDEFLRPEHHRLDATDVECYFVGEYTARHGYSHSATNQLIYNLKKSVDRRGTAEYWHKEEAIRTPARELSASLNPAFLQRGTFVPVPPSRAENDPLYD